MECCGQIMRLFKRECGTRSGYAADVFELLVLMALVVMLKAPYFSWYQKGGHYRIGRGWGCKVESKQD